MLTRFLLTFTISSQLFLIVNAQRNTSLSSIESIHALVEPSYTVTVQDLCKELELVTRVYLPSPIDSVVHRRGDVQDTLGHTVHLSRLALQFGFLNIPMQGGAISRSDQNILVGFGLVRDAWWKPAPHVYLAFTRQKYERIFIAYKWRDVRSISIYPTLKLANFLLLGFGYSRGEEELTLQYEGKPAFTRTFRISRWSPLIGLDIDLRVYRNTYLAIGLYVKEIAFFFGGGASIRF